MKVPTACRQCRESKRKCTRQGPGEHCDTCRQRSLPCDGYLGRHHQCNNRLLPAGQYFTKNDEAPRTPHHSTDEEGLNLPRGIAVEFVDHYLDKIHDRPHSLFHPPTLRAQVRQGLVGKPLLYAICALGAKFSANPDTRAWEARLAAESKQLLQADLENVCLENIQTLLLIALLNLGNGNASSEALFFRELHQAVPWSARSDICQVSRQPCQKFCASTSLHQRFPWLNARRGREFGGHFTWRTCGVSLALAWPAT